MAITALPPAPDRATPATFSAKGDAMLAALPTFITEANALQTDVNAKQVSATTQVTLATTQATNAAASATAAASSSAAVIWVSGTTYAIGNVRFSPINFQNYRRKTAGAGTVDPSTDTTNWGILATIPTVIGDAGSVLMSDGTTLSWSQVPPKDWTSVTATGSYTAPSTNIYRFYAFGQGGTANAVTAVSASSGGGGGCAYGDILLTKGQVATITITAGVTTVTVSGTVVLTAGKGGDAAAGVAGVAGTASKHATLVTNGGAFSGGAGATASGTVSVSASGASSGSVLGVGNAGCAAGTSTAATYSAASGAGWGGVGFAGFTTASWVWWGGSLAGNGNASALGTGITGSGSSSSGLVVRTKLTRFTDPLLADQNGAAAYFGVNTTHIVPGGAGSGGLGNIPAQGFGGGGGALNSGILSSAGGFGCGGGVGTSATGNAAANGYAAGGGAFSTASGSGVSTAGAAICLIYQ